MDAQSASATMLVLFSPRCREGKPHYGGDEGAVIGSRLQPGRARQAERITECATLVILRETHSAQAEIIGKQMLYN